MSGDRLFPKDPKTKSGELLPAKWEQTFAIALRQAPWFAKCVGMSCMLTALIMGIRYIGLLQPLELAAFDVMIRMRPAEKLDDRILVIEITEDDLEYQNNNGMKGKGSLSDEALSQVLDNLKPFKPATIGINIFHDFPIDENLSNPIKDKLRKHLQESDNIFMICQPSDPQTEYNGVNPMPDFTHTRLGYSDVVNDPDNVVRRSVFHMNAPQSSPCKTDFSLSMQLALHYLRTQRPELGIINVDSKTSKTTIDGKNIPIISRHWGGYQGIDDLGYQMMANYRSLKPTRTITLRQALKKDFNQLWVKDKIILFGITAPSVNNYLATPYSVIPNPDRGMAGVFLQANLTSQVISGVLDNRPWIYTLNSWQDVFLIFICANGVLGILKLNSVHNSKKRNQLLWELAMIVIQSLSLWIICILALSKIGIWLPVVPGQTMILTLYLIYLGRNLQLRYMAIF